MERSRRVRSRLSRSLLPILATAVVLCLVVVWQRDTRRRESEVVRLQPVLRPLQRYLREHDTLPLVYPHYKDDPLAPAEYDFTYVDAEIIRWARSADQPAIVGFGRASSMIGRNGRAVVIHDQGELRVEWRRVDRFNAQMADQRHAAGVPDP